MNQSETEEVPKISIAEIIMRCNDAVSKMSHQNPHRYLIYLCGFALKQLAEHLDQMEAEKAAEKKLLETVN